jgi:hypothetical protein
MKTKGRHDCGEELRGLWVVAAVAKVEEAGFVVALFGP